MSVDQTKLKDHMHWSDAVRNNLLFCDQCGEKIEQGCYSDGSGKILCDDCGDNNNV